MSDRLGATPRVAPTTQDLRKAAAAVERVGLVVRVRWLIIAALVVYSVVTLAFYATAGPVMDLGARMLVPAAALVFVAGYNGWYQATYRRLARIPFLGHGQIILDILVATVLIHYSGGVDSWFWTMYMLFTIEAAFILEDEGDTWLIAVAGAAVYGAMLTVEYYDLIPPVEMPFVGEGLSHNFTYVMILWSWVLVMNLTVALIGNNIMRTLKARERDLRRLAVLDPLTGMYNNRHFMRLLDGEVARARRYRRRLALAVVDVDDLAGHNQAAGYPGGDEMIRLVADVVSHGVRRGDSEEPYEVDMLGRLDGGRFGVVMPESDAAEASLVAERLRDSVAAVGTPRPGSVVSRQVTISVGVAAYPDDGTDSAGLLASAHEALEGAKLKGKNRVVAAGV